MKFVSNKHLCFSIKLNGEKGLFSNNEAIDILQTLRLIKRILMSLEEA